MFKESVWCMKNKNGSPLACALIFMSVLFAGCSSTIQEDALGENSRNSSNNGDNLSQSQFELKSPADMEELRSMLQEIKDNRFDSKLKVNLIASLDFEGATFEPLPEARYLEFVGNGYSLRNMAIGSATRSNHIGLFERLYSSEVSNLRLENIEVTGDTHVGALSGLIEAGSRLLSLELKNIQISGKGSTGGLAGEVADDCVISALVATEIDIQTSGIHSGGIVGLLQRSSEISNASVSSIVVNSASGSRLGGVAGTTYGASRLSNINISNLQITSNSENLGGLSGVIDATSEAVNIDVSNTTLSGSRFLGGLTGTLTNASQATNISIQNVSLTNATSYVGGVAGDVFSSHIENAEVDVLSITQSSNFLGGFFGQLVTSSAKELLGSEISILDGVLYAGGIVGYGGSDFSLDSVFLRDSTISAERQVGGLLGRTEVGGRLVNALSLDNTVAGSIDLVGGAIGYTLWDATINQVAVVGGRVFANDYVGGITGRSFSNIKNSYASTTFYRHEGDIENPPEATDNSPSIFRIGGLVGRLEDGAFIQKSYSNVYWTSVKIFAGDGPFSPIAGVLIGDAGVSNSLFNIDRLSGFLTQDNSSNWEGVSSDEAGLQTAQTYVDRNFNSEIWNLADGSFASLIFESDFD